MIRFIAAVILFAMTAVPAHARWRQATSENFVIYADDSAKDLERFATMLERFHSSLEFLTGLKTIPPSPSSRLTVYVVGGERAVRRLAGDSDYIAGFYIPRASGSVAFVQDIRITNREPDFSMIVLLHEYAHHFFTSNQRFAAPRWQSEGSAEFFASARFDKDGTIEIGRPANHRAGELFYGEQVSIRELLDHDLYAARKNKGYDSFYGRAWLLYHYLTFSDTRVGQLAEYSRLTANGKPPLESAEEVFGDLDALDEELDDYLDQKRINMLVLQPEMISPAKVEVHELSDGMDDILPLQIRSKRGVTREEALKLLPEIREVATEYPDDAGVLAALAEAEVDAGNNAEAIAAADHAIAVDPSTKNAYVQKGYALFRMAAKAKPEAVDDAYKLAMEPFSALNHLENDHPLPLIYYYRSFAERGKEPSELARQALEKAASIAPFDQALAMNLAIMLASQGRIADARLHLVPVAGNPHGGELAQAASAYLARMASADENEPFVWSEPDDGDSTKEDQDKGGDLASPEAKDEPETEAAAAGSDETKPAT